MTCPHCGKQHDSSACPTPEPEPTGFKLYPQGPVGWICPVCHGGVSPYMSFCPMCNPSFNYQYWYNPNTESAGGTNGTSGRDDKQEEN